MLSSYKPLLNPKGLHIWIKIKPSGFLISLVFPIRMASYKLKYGIALLLKDILILECHWEALIHSGVIARW